MPQRKYSKSKIESIKHRKRITLPLDLVAYNKIRDDKQAFRQYLDEMMETYPELFPEDIKGGCELPNAKAVGLPGPSVH
jgi:F0F1-type ATP synthase gamma subunit